LGTPPRVKNMGIEITKKKKKQPENTDVCSDSMDIVEYNGLEYIYSSTNSV